MVQGMQASADPQPVGGRTAIARRSFAEQLRTIKRRRGGGPQGSDPPPHPHLAFNPGECRCRGNDSGGSLSRTDTR
jgi:hypothetical protein